jgi:ABC-2 type transport system permease protein
VPRFWALFNMKKYFQLFKLTFAQYIAYRIHAFSQILVSIVTPLFMILALSVSRQTSSVSTVNLIPYYVLISLTVPLTLSSIDEELDDLVTTGDINNFLLRPYSLFFWLLAKNFSEKISIFITILPIILILILNSQLTLLTLLTSSLGIILSFLLSFTFSYLLGLFCFWIDEFWAIHNTKFVLIQLLGGIVLPYSFFPESFAKYIQFTPFPYLASWVPRFLQGQVPASSLFSILLWVIILYILVLLVERKAILKYSFTAS